jgi:eukaryotic-like serine/threonine-protein kinase
MELDSLRWERLQALFERARTMAARERDSYLDAACDGDDGLRREVDAMLVADSAEYALAIERLVNDAASSGHCEGAEPPDPFIGIRLGPWRTVGLIGRGGMGVVYLAERADGQYDQQVALKVVGPGGSNQAGALFRAERRILARLTHPNIARLLDAGFTPEGSAYMVMELVDGLPITTYCDTHRLDIDERLRLFRVVCDATQHAHQALVVHRDLKPSNIFVSRDGQVKLLDFGIAKLLDSDAGMGEAHTREHPAVTLAYAAPEQFRGEPVTTATDVYALGVVLYELLVGRRPFPGGTTSPFDVERLAAGTAPAAPSHALRQRRPADGDPPAADVTAARKTTPARLVARVRGDLDRIVLEALRPEPARRYASAGQFAEDIDRYLAGRAVNAQPDSVRYRARRFVGRNRLAVTAAGGLVMLLAVFSVTMAMQVGRTAAERDRAHLEQARAEQVVRLLVDLFETANPDVVPGGDRLAIGEFLERAEGRALRELAGQPELATRLRHVLGLMHHARSDSAHARQLLEAALTGQRGLSGADALETLAIQVDLGGLLAWMAERDPARALLDDALARIHETHGADHPLAARASHAMAGLVQRFEDKEAYLERAVAVARRRLAPTDRERILYTTSLAGVYFRRGRLDDARALFEEARRNAESINGGRTTALIAVLNESATVDNALGDYQTAESKHRRALALAMDLTGPDSFQVANARNDLAVVLANQGRLREAADALRETYARHVALFGEGHWLTTNTMRNVGMAMLLLDDPAECERWMTRAVAGVEKAAGAQDRSAAYMRAQLARCVIRGGHLDRGMALLEPAIANLESHGADVADYTANARVWLGRALLDAGRPERAEPLVAAAVAHYRRTRPSGHPVRAETECELALVLAARNRPDEALALAETCAPRVATYGQMVSWRRQQVQQLLLQRLRAPSASAALSR